MIKKPVNIEESVVIELFSGIFFLGSILMQSSATLLFLLNYVRNSFFISSFLSVENFLILYIFKSIGKDPLWCDSKNCVFRGGVFILSSYGSTLIARVESAVFAFDYL